MTITNRLSRVILYSTQRITRVVSKLWAHVVYKIVVVNELESAVQGPLIYIANHRKMTDPFLIAAFVPRSTLRHSRLIRAMTARGYYYNKLFRPYLWAMACFPAKAALDHNHKYIGVEGAVKILEEKDSLLIFPEGKRVIGEESPSVYPGIEKIRAAVPNHDSILVKITYTPRKFKRTRLHLCFFQENLDNKSAADIMQAIYSKEG